MSHLSVCLITLNEESNLDKCLSSLPKGCEIIVVDSGSHDDTLNIAKKWQAQVYTRTFDNYAAQKNFAVSKATQAFVLILDADECLDEKSREHIREIIDEEKEAVYCCTRQLIFLGKTLHFGKNKDHVIRIFPRGLCHFEGDVHEKLVVPKNTIIKKLRGKIFHNSYKNLEDYFNRFNRYTTLVAQKNFKKNKKAPVSVFLVLRFHWEFFKRYLLLGGFLDGFRGYLYAILSSVYVLIKLAKLKELEDDL